LKPIPHQIEAVLRAALQSAQAAGDLPAFESPATLPVSPPKNPSQGDYASPMALALAKSAGLKPLEIAQAVIKHLPSSDLILSAEVAPPGFINLRLRPDWILAQIETIVSQGASVFRQNVAQGRRAQVEFVSANPTGPLHIGRTRGAIIGDALARLLEACGWEVQREYYFNNAGRQMELLGLSLRARYLQALGQAADLPDKGYQGDYLIQIAEALKNEVGAEWQGKDWQPFKDYAEQHIFQMIKTTLARVRVRHDQFFNEMTVYQDETVWQTLERLREAGYIYEAVGRPDEGDEPDYEDQKRHQHEKPAVWFKSTELGDEKDRVVVKSNGDPTYALPDIAYHINKLERGFDYAFNILGSDHVVEARTVARGLTALGYDASRVEVVFHQFVTFGEGKMSTRAGNYVTLDDLIDAVGADVVRYFMLARSPNSHIEFDFDLATKQSNENPVYYIQNAHVRCCGIFRQVTERGLPDDWDNGADLTLLGAAEIGFLRKVLELPEQLVLAYENRAPHQIAFWTLDLARQFHPLYDEVRVLHSEVPTEVARARLRFYRMAKITFAYLLELMGMSAPERM
jgi:arginyl-tRNA synthetase